MPNGKKTFRSSGTDQQPITTHTVGPAQQILWVRCTSFQRPEYHRITKKVPPKHHATTKHQNIDTIPEGKSLTNKDHRPPITLYVGKA